MKLKNRLSEYSGSRALEQGYKLASMQQRYDFIWLVTVVYYGLLMYMYTLVWDGL